MPPARLAEVVADLAGLGVVAGAQWHEVAGSTNAIGVEAAARGVPEVHLVVADEQTAGRGRRGRRWLAPPGGSLLASFVTRPDVPPPDLPLLPLVAGLALAEAVERVVPAARARLKWPNDLLLAGCKAAGVLVEVVPGAAVVGIGVNVDWGADGPGPPATSLALTAGSPVDRAAVLTALAERFAARYREWCAAPRAFLPAYRDRSATVGRTVRVNLDRGALVGTATGVGSDGALALRTGDGRLHAIVAGDVEHVRAV